MQKSWSNKYTQINKESQINNSHFTHKATLGNMFVDYLHADHHLKTKTP
jgi:hypothetical protein